MNIKEIGGEFELIKRIAKPSKDPKVIVGIGDDTAVLETGDNDKFTLVTTDMIVENDHFRTDWSTPFQIGVKLMNINISDIAAMGGTPKYCLVSGCLKKETSVEFVEELFKGLRHAGKNIEIIGGDTTHGNLLVFNLTLIGEVEKDNLCLRSDAISGDLIFVSGNLGKSAAGLNLILNKQKQDNNNNQDIKYHLEPQHRLDVSSKISKHVNAMIDISDGLASEIKHICNMSKCGALIYKEKIPITKTTKENAEKVNKDPYGFALNGGEDFELLFTVSKQSYEQNKELFSEYHLIGEIKEEKEGVWLIDNNEKKGLGQGYDHFK